MECIDVGDLSFFHREGLCPHQRSKKRVSFFGRHSVNSAEIIDLTLRRTFRRLVALRGRVLVHTLQEDNEFFLFFSASLFIHVCFCLSKSLLFDWWQLQLIVARKLSLLSSSSSVFFFYFSNYTQKSQSNLKMESFPHCPTRKHLSIYLALYLSSYLALSIYLAIHPSICLALSISFSLSTSLSVRSVCLSASWASIFLP